ncbi:MAG: DNA topoisomerase IB [Dongiaceae bacterium]
MVLDLGESGRKLPDKAILGLTLDLKRHQLHYVYDTMPGISRKMARQKFVYFHPSGKQVRQKSVLEHIRFLAIPPAWTDVWICPSANGHLQATGRDAKGRKQYIYHASFREMQDATKYERLLAFAKILPRLRLQVEQDMALSGLPKRRVVATIVYLLEKTLIRIGNADYAKQNNSYGITTLRTPHVQLNGTEIRFKFTGKTGKMWKVRLKDRRVAKVIRACEGLPGQQLFQYEDDEGHAQNVDSTDVNEYLREITGQEITAKDFRTWAGTVLAALKLNDLQPALGEKEAKKNIRAVIDEVANRLGNTPAICRSCYIHPAILQLYVDGTLRLTIKARQRAPKEDTGLEAEERAVQAILRKVSRISAKALH